MTGIIPENRTQTRASYLPGRDVPIVTRIITIAITTTGSNNMKPSLRTGSPRLQRFHVESML